MADPLQAALEAAPLSIMVSARLDDVIDSLAVLHSLRLTPPEQRSPLR